MDIYKKIMKNKDIISGAVDENEVTEFLSTGVIVLNLLFSGHIDGGIPIGKLSQMAAPSGLGKSFVGLAAIASAQKRGMFCVVFDTENAFDFKWARRVGVDTSPEKLFVFQEQMIEDVIKKFLEITKELSLEERQNLFVVLDSYGGLLTSKTFIDASTGKDVTDMTEAKKKNKFAKIMMGQKVTGFVVNHVYDNIGGYGEAFKIPGGRGLEFCTSCIVQGNSIAKDKDKNKDISGAIVTAMTKKSRFGKKWSKLKYRLKDNGGLDIFYGLLDDALEYGCVEKEGTKFMNPNKDKKYWEREIYTSEFWLPVFQKTEFKSFLEDKYSYRANDIEIAEVDIKDFA